MTKRALYSVSNKHKSTLVPVSRRAGYAFTTILPPPISCTSGKSPKLHAVSPRCSSVPRAALLMLSCTVRPNCSRKVSRSRPTPSTLPCSSSTRIFMRKCSGNSTGFQLDGGICTLVMRNNWRANACCKLPSFCWSKGNTLLTTSGTGTKCLRRGLGKPLIRAIHFSRNNPGTSQSSSSALSCLRADTGTSTDTPSWDLPGSKAYCNCKAISLVWIC